MMPNRTGRTVVGAPITHVQNVSSVPRGASESESSRTLEMAHVLFTDIVAYSRLPMDEQEQVLRELQDAVRATTEFAKARAEDQLVRLPTGDGMALVFFGDAEAPVRCALELSRALRHSPRIQLRMGIHTGPVYRVADINANRNVAGGGINIAQRVMDCGDAGHILVSATVAEMLSQVSTWSSALHDLGETEVKHGLRVHLYNLYTDKACNRELPQKLSTSHTLKPPRTSRIIWKNIVLALAVAAFVAVLALGGFLLLHPARMLTDKDTIVLADFANSTGDAVFDDTLKQALSVALRQSPLLNLLSEERVRATLKLMTRPVSTPVTTEIAGEVCQRTQSRAYIAGSIARMGSQYVLGLNAVNCQNGDILAQEQVTATSKEKVLAALGAAAVKLRGELGETRSTVKKFDVPLVQATTSSLEALKAYSRAMRTGRSESPMAVVPLLQRAVEIDPNFALAYAELGVVYSDLGEAALSADFADKAFALRDRASEWERFSIDSTYYRSVTGQLEKAEEVSEEWKQTYPQDPAPYVQLGLIYSSLGRLESALNTDLEALKLRTDSAAIYANLTYDYLYLDRLNEAATILDQARAMKLDETLLPNFYQLAFLRQDGKEMKKYFSAALGQVGQEDALLSSEADTEAFHGRLRKARELSQRAVDSAMKTEGKETAAGWRVSAALREAEFGNKAEAKRQAELALALASNRDVQVAAALALARVGDIGMANTIAYSLQGSLPSNTILSNYWIPCIRAATALFRADAPQAITYLAVTAPYELAAVQPPFPPADRCILHTFAGRRTWRIASGTWQPPSFKRYSTILVWLGTSPLAPWPT